MAPVLVRLTHPGSSCNTWSGGSASFSDGQGNWIWAASTSGGPKDTSDQSASINQHGEQNSFQWSYASAKGGNSVNPLVNASPSSGASTGTRSCVPRPASTAGSSTTGGAGGSPTTNAATATKTDDDDRHRGRPTNYPGYFSGTPFPTGEPDDHYSMLIYIHAHSIADSWTERWEWEKRQDVVYCDEASSDGASSNSGVTVLGGRSSNEKLVVAHGAIAALAFVILFPFGAIAIRLASFTGLVWMHAAFQAFAYLMYIVAFGLGVYIANQKKEVSTVDVSATAQANDPRSTGIIPSSASSFSRCSFSSRFSACSITRCSKSTSRALFGHMCTFGSAV